MIIKLNMDSGANIHSKKVVEFDLEKTTGITDEEWAEMSHEDKTDTLLDIVFQHFTWDWEEL